MSNLYMLRTVNNPTFSDGVNDRLLFPWEIALDTGS